MKNSKKRSDKTTLRPVLAVIVPCYNEEAVLDSFAYKLKAELEKTADYSFTILFVDDGSVDSTPDILQKLSKADKTIQICTLARNFGHQIAISAGISIAESDAVIIMDSDLQHPPELIHEMLKQFEKGFDIVSAVRKKTEGTGFIKNITSYMFYKIINMLSDTYIEPGAADFCLLSRKAYTEIHNMQERHRFLRGMIAWTGLSRTFIPFTASEREAGYSKYNFSKMLTLAFDAITSFSVKPIRLAVKLGLFIVSLGFFYLSYVIIGWFLFDDFEKGWSSIISTVLILGGLQLFFIGLIGEYIAKIFEETKNRPLFVKK